MSSSDPPLIQSRFVVYVSSGLVALSTVAVTLRLLSRFKSRRPLFADDWALAISLIPLWGLYVASYFAAFGGTLATNATPSQLAVFFKAIFAAGILYEATITTVKLSILLQYYRVFPSRRFRHVVLAVETLCMLWFIAVVMIGLLQCQPIAYAWNKSVSNGTCFSQTSMVLGVTISDALIDLAIILIPVEKIWTLRLPAIQRVILLCVLFFGFLVAVASVGRVASVLDLSATLTFVNIMMMVSLFTVFAPAFAIICICLPSYLPFFQCFSKGRHNPSRNISLPTPWIEGQEPNEEFEKFRARASGHSSVTTFCSDIVEIISIKTTYNGPTTSIDMLSPTSAVSPLSPLGQPECWPLTPTSPLYPLLIPDDEELAEYTPPPLMVRQGSYDEEKEVAESSETKQEEHPHIPLTYNDEIRAAESPQRVWSGGRYYDQEHDFDMSGFPQSPPGTAKSQQMTFDKEMRHSKANGSTESIESRPDETDIGKYGLGGVRHPILFGDSSERAVETSTVP